MRDVGGLLVIGTERHRNRRVDNQLRGCRPAAKETPVNRLFLTSPDDEIITGFAHPRLPPGLTIEDVEERAGRGRNLRRRSPPRDPAARLPTRCTPRRALHLATSATGRSIPSSATPISFITQRVAAAYTLRASKAFVRRRDPQHGTA